MLNEHLHAEIKVAVVNYKSWLRSKALNNNKCEIVNNNQYNVTKLIC
jgi:hypothetical protein